MAIIQPPLLQIPSSISSVDDYRVLAEQHLSTDVLAWLNGGAADEQSLADNRAAFDKIRLNSRVLQAMHGGNTQLELFGQRFDYPIFLAPIAHHHLVHEHGESASLLAASAMNAGMVVSTQAGVRLEQLAAEAHAPLWFQLYIQPDRAFTGQLIKRAENAGYQALVLSVDAPISGLRNREQRNGFVMPESIKAVNLEGMKTIGTYQAQAGQSPLFNSPLLAHAATWQDIQWLKKHTHLPIIIKGIMHPSDALLAIEQGADGIIVSNHGGRVLDGVPASIDALPAIANVVGERVPILMDGGIRRGTDIIKALALGAKAVLIGRPYLQAVACAGAPGVAHVLHLLRSELELAMIHIGCHSLADIQPAIIWQKDRPLVNNKQTF